ncbi:MAG: TIGR02300 family protein [Candidatus Puniceispirillales bacterium]
MANPEWGKKRICLACNTKYYDFNKSPIICPSCGIEFDPDTYLKSKKGKNLLTNVVLEKNKNTSEEMSNIDAVETDIDEEVLTDDDALLEINTEDQSKDLEVEINIDEDVSFIDEDEINEDDDINEEIIDEKK